MTPEQAAQRVRQIALKLEIADYGMGMPRDYQCVCELRVMLNDAIKDHANALIAADEAEERQADEAEHEYFQRVGS